MSPSARQIIELNIEYFRKKLETESEPFKRRIIAGLLRDEEARLRSINQDPPADPARPNPASGSG